MTNTIEIIEEGNVNEPRVSIGNIYRGTVTGTMYLLVEADENKKVKLISISTGRSVTMNKQPVYVEDMEDIAPGEWVAIQGGGGGRFVFETRTLRITPQTE